MPPHIAAMAKKAKGEVKEIIQALEVLSAQNGQRPDVVQNKRDCFQARRDAGGRGPRGGAIRPLAGRAGPPPPPPPPPSPGNRLPLAPPSPSAVPSLTRNRS